MNVTALFALSHAACPMSARSTLTFLIAPQCADMHDVAQIHFAVPIIACSAEVSAGRALPFQDVLRTP